VLIRLVLEAAAEADLIALAAAIPADLAAAAMVGIMDMAEVAEPIQVAAEAAPLVILVDTKADPADLA
jgi:hypothetical protein